MCLVIDSCCLMKVFDPNNKEHREFVPVWEWISRGRGRMIYGGTKYLKELSEVTKVLRLVSELLRQGRVQVVSRARVDELASEVKRKVNDNDFNDEHLVAIVIVSRCHIVCTDDKRAIPYLKRTGLYADRNVKRPRIYQKRRAHGHLCCDKHVVGWHGA